MHTIPHGQYYRLGSVIRNSMLSRFNILLRIFPSERFVLSLRYMANDSTRQSRTNALQRLNHWITSSANPIPLKVVGESGPQPGFDVCFDPVTDKPLVQFKESTPADVDQIVRKASEAQEAWYSIPPMERAKILHNLASRVRLEADRISELEVLDTGKPLWEARADVDACADTIDLFAGFIGSLTGTHSAVPPNPASFYYTRREPFGVCAGIGAWNFPFQMAVWKSAPAIAAGNALVFKPSPLTVLSAVRLSQLYHEAGCPQNLFSVALGGTQVGQALINHPLVSKVSFTGGVAGGSAVLATAATRIIPSTVELGGKSALIIMPDADLDEAVKGTLMANFYTQGQVCSNAARVFVHSSIFNRFTEKLLDAVQKLRLGDPFDPHTSMGAMISKDHLEKVKRYIHLAVSEGAKVLYGGEQPAMSPSLGCGVNFLTPCVLTQCHDDMISVKEEIFGPVITLLKFESEEEVVRRANNSDLGLAGGVFTRDLSTAHRIAALLQCGSVYVNSYNNYPPGVPFGGYRRSGFGRENCQETLLSYTQLKSVYVEGAGLPDPFPH